jgi:hypothetical protein
MQRRALNAARKDGFSAAVSERALLSVYAIFGSLAQDGISPQRRKAGSILPCSERRAKTGCVGAML